MPTVDFDGHSSRGASEYGRDVEWPIVVGHRGASAEFPENTLQSFEGAIEAGADVVELDVRLTADRVPVIMHDADVSATTNGSGFVHELTLSEIKRLNAGRGDGAAHGVRAKVPTFREALELLTGRAGVNAEIKNMPGEPGFDSPREEVVEHVIELLEETKFQGEVLISSFNWLSVERARRLRPDIPTGFLSTASIDPWASLVYVKSQGHDYVLPQYPLLLETGEAFVDQAHRESIRVGTWTVDEPEVMDRLFAIGVDAIATNRPDVAVPVRDRFRSRRRAE
jgi:glycerophosphoryl diester phosphodiesterase